jgi:uncharacterized surface protein with fasciclin (FAS1) repeats
MNDQFMPIYVGLTHMKRNQFRGALATALGVTLAAAAISTSQAQSRLPEMTVPSTPSVPGTPSVPSTPSIPGQTTMPSASATPNPTRTSVPRRSQSPQPTSTSTATPSATSSPRITEPSSQNGSTIVDLAIKSKQFKTLVAAVKAAELVDTLSSEGPFTLFAPNDKAFAKLDQNVLKKLLKPVNKDALQKVLKYHVLSGAVMAKDIKAGSVKTVEGNTVRLRLPRSGVTVNGAKVLKADVSASNGVVHTIDTVLIPPGLKLK